MCLDPRELNKAILREHYPLKTVEVDASLKQAKHFTTMDAASGFYQIQLTEESSWLTTFNTPFGRYKFERIPFGKFIPNLSARNQPLRQLEHEVDWHWDEAQERAFNDLKEAITSTPTLKYFDVSDDITLSVDASSFGLGACIMQREQPVAYASRALNTAERNYAQIEKEMLGIVYGLQKFNEYVYGKTVLVETDHKPLESLFKKPLSSAPPRLQRMMLKDQQHDIVVKYKAGKELYIADTLSRSKGFEQVGTLRSNLKYMSLTLFQ